MAEPVATGVAVARPDLDVAEVQSQLGAAQATRGPGDLRVLLESGGVWDAA